MQSSQQSLYAALKDDVAAVADPLFRLSEALIRKYGNFLPHGLVLHDLGKDTVVGAVEDNGTGKSSSTQTLPLVHEGLRQEVRTRSSRAIGVAENVTITPDSGSRTCAIKVLFEHRDGLCVALYLPFKRRFLRGYEFGSIFTIAAEPEVKPWARGEA
ncbi:hypothetical protein [Hydrogenophaga sp.]|uniref:hypothetical protein n=1 Tax=Hydrogenophaga sp. TaxID=1904254 RepID=UPI0026259AF1|nr:hypothetical protein [Hydrogenophaga sp.]MDM7948112.1 hypothetical protein [Hydrogenophaga sp.]